MIFYVREEIENELQRIKFEKCEGCSSCPNDRSELNKLKEEIRMNITQLERDISELENSKKLWNSRQELKERCDDIKRIMENHHLLKNNTQTWLIKDMEKMLPLMKKSYKDLIQIRNNYTYAQNKTLMTGYFNLLNEFYAALNRESKIWSRLVKYQFEVIQLNKTFLTRFLGFF